MGLNDFQAGLMLGFAAGWSIGLALAGLLFYRHLRRTRR